jgi:hypothetical protein
MTNRRIQGIARRGIAATMLVGASGAGSRQNAVRPYNGRGGRGQEAVKE